jgi:3-oxoadipate enol-lactonase
VPAELRIIDVPGARLAAEAEGDGPPIVLLHSALVNRRSWDALTPRLVAAGYRVIRYDLRGFGGSTTEDVEFSPTADLRAVMRAFGVERAALVGNSMGAILALDAVLESAPELVAFVWVGGGIGGLEPNDAPAEVAAWEQMQQAHDEGDLDAEAEWDVRIWVDGIGQPETRVPREIRDAVRTMDRPLLDPARVFGRRIRPDPPANDRLGEVRVPTLVVVGTLDTSATRAAADRLAGAVAGARLVTLPDVAHMIGMEAPERLASLIVDFLAPLPRWA